MVKWKTNKSLRKKTSHTQTGLKNHQKKDKLKKKIYVYTGSQQLYAVYTMAAAAV